jgi:glucokinase
MTTELAPPVDLMVRGEDRERDEAAIRFLRAVHGNGLRNRRGPFDEGFPGLTHVEAARLAELSRPSIASFARRMQGSVLREKALAIKPKAGYAIGVDFGRAHDARVALGDIHGEVLQVYPEESATTPLTYQSPSSALKTARKHILRALSDRKLDPTDLVGIGISLPGPVKGGSFLGTDTESMQHLNAWKRLNAAEELEQELKWKDIGNVKFKIQSDTYLSALAEHLWGGGQTSSNTLYVKWSAALRTAIMIHGQLYVGHSGTAGELPHVEVTESNGLPGWKSVRPCEICKRPRCLHAIAPLPEISEILGESRKTRASKIIELAESDPEKQEVLNIAARAIGRSIGPLVDALDPKIVVVGGALGSRVFPLVRETLAEGIHGSRFAAEGVHGGQFAVRTDSPDELTVRAGRIEQQTAVRGALALALLEFAPEFLQERAD